MAEINLSKHDIDDIWQTVKWSDLNPLQNDFNEVLRIRFARAIEAAVLAAATPGQVEADAEFEILQDDHPVASSFGPRARAAREALHYAAQYAQDGELTIVEVTRKAITIDALKSASVSEQKGEPNG